MPLTPAETVRSIYDAFALGDVPAILNSLDERIDWRSPANLPHGGHFTGRDQVGRFFQGIGEHWENLALYIDHVLASEDQVVVLATIHGRLRSTGEDSGYTAAHAWTIRDGTPVAFAETVDAPVALPLAVATG